MKRVYAGFRTQWISYVSSLTRQVCYHCIYSKKHIFMSWAVILPRAYLSQLVGEIFITHNICITELIVFKLRLLSRSWRAQIWTELFYLPLFTTRRPTMNPLRFHKYAHRISYGILRTVRKTTQTLRSFAVSTNQFYYSVTALRPYRQLAICPAGNYTGNSSCSLSQWRRNLYLCT